MVVGYLFGFRLHVLPLDWYPLLTAVAGFVGLLAFASLHLEYAMAVRACPEWLLVLRPEWLPVLRAVLANLFDNVCFLGRHELADVSSPPPYKAIEVEALSLSLPEVLYNWLLAVSSVGIKHSSNMFIKPGSLSKQVTEIEIERRQTIQENREKMKALGIQPMANSLIPSNQNAKGKRTKDGKNKVGHGADPEYVPLEGEESLSSCSDDDEFSRPPMKKVRSMGPGGKKSGSSTQVLRKSPRIQEEGGSHNGSTSALPTEPTANDAEGMPLMVAQPSQLPTSPTEETNQLSSPCNVVGGMGSTSIPSTQRRRGPTRGVNVDKLRKKLGRPIAVEIDREAMAIVGDYATPVANAIGESIRAHAPVRDIGWGAVEFGIRESIVLRVGQTFGLGDYKNDMVLRRIIDIKCQSLYANWKTRLYTQYKKLKKKYKKKGGPDPRTCPLYPCNPADWVFMIDNVWQKKAWRKKSKRGKKARKGLKYNHTSGSQSFVARASMHVKDGKKKSFPERFKETHIRHREGDDVWINDKAKKHHDEMLKIIQEQSQPDVTNSLSEEQVSVEVLGKRSGYLKGYGIRRSRLSTLVSQGVPNSEVVALKQQVANQGKIMAEQGQVIADYGKKFEKMMLMLASGVDPTAIPGLIQGSEHGDDSLGGQQNGTSTS